MDLPRELAVMVLPHATLFPQALLPLRIFEPRYRRMLRDALQGPRMFIVAMQKPWATRESTFDVAGLGLIRVSVDNPNGTSHLILQGLTRVRLESAVKYRPYRLCRFHPIPTPPANDGVIHDLLVQVRHLVNERVQLGKTGKPAKGGPTAVKGKGWIDPKDVVQYLDQIEDPAQVADLVSCALLQDAAERQMLLETIELEPRLTCLIHFLRDEIRQQRKAT